MERLGAMEKQRTIKQNRALHLMFEQLADNLNNEGMSVQKVLTLEAKFTGKLIKELLWRPTQKWLYKKKSTTELTTKELDEVFEVIQKALAEKGIEIQFPSIETIMMNERTDENIT